MTILASDNFTRADSASLGANWTANSAEPDTTGFGISGNTAIPNVRGSDSSDVYSAIAWPNDGYAQVVINATATEGLGTGVGPTLRWSASAVTGYRLVGCASGIELDQFKAGVMTALYSNASPAVAANDILRLEITTNGSSANWVIKKNGVVVSSGTDASPVASGSAGIGHSSTTTASALTSWEGGNFLTAGGPVGRFVAPVLLW